MQRGADDAVQAALRMLRHRDRSVAQVDRALEERGVEQDERSEVLATLTRVGLVDDREFAARRAGSLSDRGAGNALIRHDLAAAGVAEELIDDAVGGLEGEHDRARRIVQRRGVSAKTARYLAGKGFAHDVVEAIVARAGDEPLG